MERIDIGIKYCDNLHHNKIRCTRLGSKYDCENCTVPASEQKQICIAWKRIIYLAKLHSMCQLLDLLNRYIDLKETEQIFDMSKKQGKAELILPNSQMRLFKGVR